LGSKRNFWKRPKFVFDENFPPALVELAALMNEWHCDFVHHSELYDRGSTDEEWVPQALKDGHIVVTRDTAMKTKKPIKGAVRRFPRGAIVFLPGRTFGNMKIWGLARWIFDSWPDILQTLMAKGPGVYWSSRFGKLRGSNKRKKTTKKSR
jgi:hypothetical protein